MFSIFFFFSRLGQVLVCQQLDGVWMFETLPVGDGLPFPDLVVAEMVSVVLLGGYTRVCNADKFLNRLLVWCRSFLVFPKQEWGSIDTKPEELLFGIPGGYLTH